MCWASSFFFRTIYPLLGVWAAIRVVREHNFRYPVIGRLAERWATRHPVEEGVVAEEEESTSDESILAGISHLSILGLLAVALGPILWTTSRRRSRFLTRHVFQAAHFQLWAMGVGVQSQKVGGEGSGDTTSGVHKRQTGKYRGEHEERA